MLVAMKYYLLFVFVAGLLMVSSCNSDDDPIIIDPFDIKSKVNVKAQVGGVLYENVKAVVVVEAFAPNEVLQWSEEFDYSGAESETLIFIPAGYEYYVFTAKVWGSEDSQTISGQQLYDERADGPTPTTYVFAPELEPPTLKSVIRSFDTSVNGTVEMLPYSKEEFEWVDGQLTAIKDYEYDIETEQFLFKRYFSLIYENDRVVKMNGFQVSDDELYIETTYEYYPNGNVSQIRELNHGTGITSEANITYNYEAQKATVQYVHSNGQSLTYEFAMAWKNLVSDKTTKGATICSEGEYGFDKNINPYYHLGYTDLLMTNLSINNKMSDDVDYKACAFPDITVLSHEFSYDNHGLPLSRTSTYSNGMKGREVYGY
jgi:hypothetical protein